MQLTKFTHSCVRFDDGDRTLVLDPGVFSEVSAALDGADAVLVTHEHADHVDVEQLKAAAARDPRLRVWAPQAVIDQLALGEQGVAVQPGHVFDAAGFEVRTFGGQHAVIHPSIPVIANIGYLIADTVYHPGDSFTVPPVEVKVLLAPLHAPWSKVSEVIDFAIAVRAPRVHNLHDVLLIDAGRAMVENHLARIGGEFGLQFSHLDPAGTVDV